MPICEQCGAEFDGRVDARYCSGKCRTAAYRIRHGVTDKDAETPAGAGPGTLRQGVTESVTDDDAGPVIVADYARAVTVELLYIQGHGWREVRRREPRGGCAVTNTHNS